MGESRGAGRVKPVVFAVHLQFKFFGRYRWDASACVEVVALDGGRLAQ